MQEISNLLKILESFSSTGNNLLKDIKPNSLESLFVANVLKGKFKTDKDAALELYSTDQSDFRYKMLKHRIKKKIYRCLLVSELANLDVAFQKEQECLRLISLSRLLLRKAQLDVVLGLCSKVKLAALEYEFNDLYLNALEIEAECLIDTGSLKELLKIKQLQKEYERKVSLEKEAVSLFQQAKAYVKSTVKHRKEHLNELPSVIERLKYIWEDTQSFESYNAYFKTSMILYELIGDFNAIIKLTERTEAYISEGRVNPKRFDAKYNAYILVYAHLRNKSFERGLSFAEKFYPYFREATPNWFFYMENYFLLALHGKHYELASLLMNKVTSHINFKEKNKEAKERWQLYEAYLYFFKPALSTHAEITYQNFISSFTEYSKDKQGFNVAILVLQFMYFLRKNDSESLLYRIESLKKYSSTHLKDAASLRSRLFLKLLMLIVTEDFDAEASSLKGAKYYQKLSETPTPGDAFAEIEIIPYEHLWEMILEILKRRN